jgi:hypothetical protein
MFQLVDFFSLFYLNFMKTAKQSHTNFWSSMTESARHRAWSGYAFELVCMQHTAQIRQKLGVTGIITSASTWRSKKSDPAVQIDLLIERNDGVINICEMKYANDEFVIDKEYDKELRYKRSAFQSETKTRKAVHITMVTTFGVKFNLYRNSYQSEVTVNDLFNTIIN